MKVFALADTHLSFANPAKTMDLFGQKWVNHYQTIQSKWSEVVTDNDLVLIAGDISWASKLQQAHEDLKWIDQLPGKKVISKGNHDYWWPSMKKLEELELSTIAFVHHSEYSYEGLSIAGLRLWDCNDFNFDGFIDWIDLPQKEGVKKPSIEEKKEETQRLYERELERLELTLKLLDQEADKRILMCHYPPLPASLASSRATNLIDQYHVDLCVFGHLHNVRKDSLPFGVKNHTRYVLTSCDYLQFMPVRIL